MVVWQNFLIAIIESQQQSFLNSENKCRTISEPKVIVTFQFYFYNACAKKQPGWLGRPGQAQASLDWTRLARAGPGLAQASKNLSIRLAWSGLGQQFQMAISTGPGWPSLDRASLAILCYAF